MGIIRDILKKWRRPFDLDDDQDDPDNENVYREYTGIVRERKHINMHDRAQRETYVRGCLDQISYAAREIDSLNGEYNMVTAYLKDIEIIDSLASEDRALLSQAAEKVAASQDARERYDARKVKMDETEYRMAERLSLTADEGIEKLKDAEDYQDKIDSDLKKLSGERRAMKYRKNELNAVITDTKSMTVMCVVTLSIIITLLLILQFVFKMDTGWGYVIAGGVAAVLIATLFVHHQDAVSDMKVLNSEMNRLVVVTNKVKIRYVNNVNLLEYLRLKYGAESSKELERLMDRYEAERSAREEWYRNSSALDEGEKELMTLLRQYGLRDPVIWLKQSNALMDEREMVEIRHNLIKRRQTLRERVSYNRDVIAGKAREEIKGIVRQYPQYSDSVTAIVDSYVPEKAG
ncbi:MAG: hypothetical protein K6E33_08945 [Lachnospiraceae bacterium]|nr:hypothetical protein [Lachnospiraceae bacterium]